MIEFIDIVFIFVFWVLLLNLWLSFFFFLVLEGGLNFK